LTSHQTLTFMVGGFLKLALSKSLQISPFFTLGIVKTYPN
jgi:hypothetical protein